MQLRCKYCKAVQPVSVADEADEDLRTQGIRRAFRAEHQACGEKAVTLEIDVDASIEVDTSVWERYIAAMFNKPDDVTLGADGFFSRTITRDGQTHSVRVCEDCWRNIPRYVDFPAGLTSPESDGEAGTVAKLRVENVETDSPKRRQAVAHLRKAVCLDCYLKAFARVYPGAKMPTLDGSVVGDGAPVEIPSEPEPVGRI